MFHEPEDDEEFLFRQPNVNLKLYDELRREELEDAFGDMHLQVFNRNNSCIHKDDRDMRKAVIQYHYQKADNIMKDIDSTMRLITPK